MSDTPVLQAVEKICRGKKTIPTSFQTTLQSQLKRGKGGKGSGKPAKSDEGSDGSSRPPEGGMDTVLKRFLEIMPGKK